MINNSSRAHSERVYFWLGLAFRPVILLSFSYLLHLVRVCVCVSEFTWKAFACEKFSQSAWYTSINYCYYSCFFFVSLTNTRIFPRIFISIHSSELYAEFFALWFSLFHSGCNFSPQLLRPNLSFLFLLCKQNFCRLLSLSLSDVRLLKVGLLLWILAFFCLVRSYCNVNDQDHRLVVCVGTNNNNKNKTDEQQKFNTSTFRQQFDTFQDIYLSIHLRIYQFFYITFFSKWNFSVIFFLYTSRIFCVRFVFCFLLFRHFPFSIVYL